MVTVIQDMLSLQMCCRLKSVTPQHFLSGQKKLLMRTLKLNLGKDVTLVSIQDAPQGNLDILLHVRGVSCNKTNI